MDLLDRLLAQDGDGFMRAAMRRELQQPGPAHRELTFNVFDVTLDFDRGTAVVYDELDADDSLQLALDEVRRRLDGTDA